MCKKPAFEDYCARPYLLGLQDKLFGCGDAVHDWYHVEPQAPCLVDDSGDLAVDVIIRCALFCALSLSVSLSLSLPLSLSSSYGAPSFVLSLSLWLNLSDRILGASVHLCFGLMCFRTPRVAPAA